jgi:hypothetical protein
VATGILGGTVPRGTRDCRSSLGDSAVAPTACPTILRYPPILSVTGTKLLRTVYAGASIPNYEQLPENTTTSLESSQHTVNGLQVLPIYYNKQIVVGGLLSLGKLVFTVPASLDSSLIMSNRQSWTYRGKTAAIWCVALYDKTWKPQSNLGIEDQQSHCYYIYRDKPYDPSENSS